MWTLSGFADEIDADLDVQCDTLAADDIRHLELRSVWDTNVCDLDDDQVARVAETVGERGIGVSSIGSPIGKISVTDPFAPHLARFRRALDVAGRLGASYVRVFSFYLPDGDDPAAHRDEVLRRLSTLADEAGRAGVTLLHENEKEIYGDTPARCHDLLESVGSPHLRAAWDAANFVQVGARPFTQAYALLRPYVAYVQVKDALLATGEVVPAGEGDGEVPETLAALHADGFDGYFSMEPHLAATGPLGGFSGPGRWRHAVAAFTGLLTSQRIPWE
ncbi:MAG: sugar phosphate isomerase/epimerase family protein [Actinomycetes bacterium]